MTLNDPDINSLNYQNGINSCQYYTVQDFLAVFSKDDKRIDDNNNNNNNLSLLHINSRSINKHFDSFETFFNLMKNFKFSVIGISETWLHSNSPDIYNIPNYKMIHIDRKDGRGGGVALYIHTDLKFVLRNDFDVDGIDNVFVEIINTNGKNIIIGTLYRVAQK